MPPRVEEPEVLRLNRFENALSSNMIKGWPLTSAELFEAEFGDGGTAYWTLILSEPMSARMVAWHLAWFLTEEHPNARQGLLEEGVLKALQKWTWIVTGAKPADDQDALLIINPLAAVGWIASAPLQRHWAPASLQAWLQSRSAPASEPVVKASERGRPVLSGTAKKRQGRPPGITPGMTKAVGYLQAEQGRGKWKRGDPITQTMATVAGVSISTLRRAIDELQKLR